MYLTSVGTTCVEGVCCMLMFAKVCIEVTPIMFNVMQANNELPSCEEHSASVLFECKWDYECEWDYVCVNAGAIMELQSLD